MKDTEPPNSIEVNLSGNQRSWISDFKNIETPALIVDKSAFNHNLASAENMFRGTGKFLRPHVKVHRTPGLALRQLVPFTCGVTCATISEAEAMVAAGIDNVLIANEIVSERKLERLVSLADSARIIIAVDAIENLYLISKISSGSGQIIEVLVDLDMGLGRCGVDNPEAAIELALAISRAPGVRFAGIMGYEGRIRASFPDREQKIKCVFKYLAKVKRTIEREGLRINIVSASGTSTIIEALEDETVTEIQAGTYALMEPDIEDLNLPFRCAVSILATVISRTSGRVVLDAGRRAFGFDYGHPISLNPAGKTLRITDDHTILNWNGDLPPLGAKLQMRPTQNRTTFNVYDHIWLIGEDGMVEEKYPVVRGRT